MKRFNVKVNGITYQVEVEELSSGASAAPLPAGRPVMPVHSQPVNTAPAAVPPSTAPNVQVAQGETPVIVPMPGKVTKIMVEVGQQIQKGQVMMILEAMKMQNEIPSPMAGTVKAIHVAADQGVKPGEVVAVIG